MATPQIAASSYPITEGEVDHYEQRSNDEENEQMLRSHLAQVVGLPASSFAAPVTAWLDAPYDSVAQSDCYEHIGAAVRRGGAVLQLGGSGSHAVKSLLGGARHAYLLTPVPGETAIAQRLAEHFDVADRLTTIVGVAEEFPQIEPLDAIISGGCLHHVDVPVALPQIKAALVPGGRFAAWDPWRAFLYRVGVTVLGKRERNVQCRPLDSDRLSAFAEVFPGHEVRLHGALLRYPMLALSKAGVEPPLAKLHRIALLDDRLAQRSPRLARSGSSVAVLATKNG
jgi:SAM-dependent methyltransferase